MVGCTWWWSNILKITIQRLQKMIDPKPKRFDVQGIGTTSSQTGGGGWWREPLTSNSAQCQFLWSIYSTTKI
jgi:hypothetical protein